MYRYSISIGTMTKGNFYEGFMLHKREFTEEKFVEIVNKAVDDCYDKDWNNLSNLANIRNYMITEFGFEYPEKAVCNYWIGDGKNA